MSVCECESVPARVYTASDKRKNRLRACDREPVRNYKKGVAACIVTEMYIKVSGTRKMDYAIRFIDKQLYKKRREERASERDYWRDFSKVGIYTIFLSDETNERGSRKAVYFEVQPREPDDVPTFHGADSLRHATFV